MQSSEFSLHWLAIIGDIDALRAMDQTLSEQINARNNMGDTMLHLAIHSCNLEMVKFLVEKGADLEMKDHNGHTALLIIETHQGLVKFERLLQHGISSPEGEITKFLLDSGADVNAKDGFAGGGTILHSAVRDVVGPETFKYLLDHGGRVDEPDLDGRTALHVACIMGLRYMVRILLSYGASMNSIDNFGNTPLYYAQKNSQKKVVAYVRSVRVLTLLCFSRRLPNDLIRHYFIQ